MDDISDDLTPEQKLGAIILQAGGGEYRKSVPRFAWEMYAERVQFESLQFAFDEYVEAKINERKK